MPTAITMRGFMVRKLLAAIAGLVVAVAIVALIETLGFALFPPPGGLDFDGKEQLLRYIKTLPVPVLLIVLLSWSAGVFAGSVTATILVWRRARMGCLIVTGFVLIAAISNMLMIPHPEWFMLAAIMVIPLAGYLAWWVSVWFLARAVKA